MLQLPERLPTPVVLLLAASLLAALDLLGAVAAKNWSEHHTFPWFAAGALVFVVVFWVYGSVLQIADLSIVTLGWIVLLQVSVVILDYVRYHVPVTPMQLGAIALILILQGYLVLSSAGNPVDPEPTTPMHQAQDRRSAGAP
jgi:peptidoglycan/LPS O-acetylase OafA/YrhL